MRRLSVLRQREKNSQKQQSKKKRLNRRSEQKLNFSVKIFYYFLLFNNIGMFLV